MVSAQARLAQARYALSRGVSQRRACALMDHYNEIRPHSSLSYLTPRQFVGTLNQKLGAPGQNL